MIPQMIYNMGTNILRAVGDSKRPLYFLIVASIVNIVLDIVLVAVIPLGVAGAAIATVASQVVSAVLTVRCIHGSQGMPWHLQLKNIRIERSVLLAICRIGLPGAAQSALYSISNMTIQSAINGFGTVAVAAWSVYGKIDFLFWMTVSSFGIAVTTFAGQNFGARQYDRDGRYHPLHQPGAVSFGPAAVPAVQLGRCRGGAGSADDALPGAGVYDLYLH